MVAELADGAILDTRVLLADRLGADEAAWPSPEDRFASDLLRARTNRRSLAAGDHARPPGSRCPILLGAHTLVGPGIPVVLAWRQATQYHCANNAMKTAPTPAPSSR